jgi:murein DD-endopeptidase MepM/ murein hydrolase activator NlpD
MLSQDKLDPYSLYINAGHLAKEPIQNRVEAVPVLASSQRSFEDELAAKLTKLEDAVESATALGFFKRGRDSNGEVLALVPRTESENRDSGQLAAILEDPTLVKKESAKRRGPRANIGGSESECGDAFCTFGVKKEDVTMRTSTDQSFNQTVESILSERQRRLRQRLERAIFVMRVLPLGSPADGEISSEFGYRRSPFSRRASFHEGIDVSLRRGNRVVVTGSGVVDRVAYNRTYGTVIDVKHAAGIVTRYAHLTKSLVKQGQKVSRGDLIALSGNTGRSTGPHLHYEVLFNDRPRDPRPFIELADELSGW